MSSVSLPSFLPSFLPPFSSLPFPSLHSPLPTILKKCKDDANEEDIVDEALKLYKPNTLFRTFDIHGSADRTLIYAILYTTDALARLSTAFPKGTPPTQTEAARILNAHAMDTFALPGDAAFPRIHTLTAPTSRADAGPPFLFIFLTLCSHAHQ